ncbi:uncharacterized protein LOC119306686 [Triticum dicoccoides]|uniref:uncharacterized protein LOC119306686 n=1 Tax=Triticum dicoccoides TaxID=85692 RepID=UPI00189085BB|nr:uncharacterized protein LOC119306686 [Triticum dicoccoides]
MPTAEVNFENDELQLQSPPREFDGYTWSVDDSLESPLSEIASPPTAELEQQTTTPNQVQSDQSGPHQCPWKRRIRRGKIPDQRQPKQGRVCALEKAMRDFVQRKSGQVVAPEIGREFDSLAEAFEFYNLYSWEIGFGIRYGQSRTNAQI